MKLNEQPALSVHAIVFTPDDLVEITFSEARDQSPDIQVMKVLRLDPQRNGRVIEAMISEITDLVDATLVRLRDDPDELPGR